MTIITRLPELEIYQLVLSVIPRTVYFKDFSFIISTQLYALKKLLFYPVGWGVDYTGCISAEQ